jgi:hypothetical protein
MAIVALEAGMIIIALQSSIVSLPGDEGMEVLIDLIT